MSAVFKTILSAGRWYDEHILSCCNVKIIGFFVSLMGFLGCRFLLGGITDFFIKKKEPLTYERGHRSSVVIDRYDNLAKLRG
jgi:hypothetical protein